MQFIEPRPASSMRTLLGWQLESPVCGLQYDLLGISDHSIAPKIKYLVDLEGEWTWKARLWRTLPAR